MLPKKAKNDLNAYTSLQGRDRVSQIIEESDRKTTFHPEGIHLDDIDIAFFNDLKESLPPFRGRELNVVWPSVQKWGDFLNTFKMQDDDGNITRPYCVVQRTASNKGTKNNEKYNIPNNRLFTYTKVPVSDPDGKLIGADIYQIPQPITIDLTYDIAFTSNNQIEMNRFVEHIYTKYASFQNYINVKGHFMPVTMLNDIFEKSTQVDDEGNYMQKYEFLCKGYVKNPDDFRIVRSVRRSVTTINVK